MLDWHGTGKTVEVKLYAHGLQNPAGNFKAVGTGSIEWKPSNKKRGNNSLVKSIPAVRVVV